MTTTEISPIVYSHVFPWEMPPSRQQYLTQALSAYTHVVYLNLPRTSRRIVEIKQPYVERISPTLTVIHNAYAFRLSRAGLRLGPVAALLDTPLLRDTLRRIGVTDYIYWLAAAYAPLARGVDMRRLVYDCMDPLFEDDAAKRFAHERDEAAYARHAQVVFATAQTLLEKMQPFNSHTYSLPNACDFETYDLHHRPTLPHTLAERKRPIIGYMGAFDWRIDVETLYQAASLLPDYTFALVGRIHPTQEARVAALRVLPNVVMPGQVSLEEGQAYTAAFDVGLIPFLPGEVGDAINPVKMYMYLAGGKPVVTTWLRECYSNPLVAATRTVDEFVAAIRAAVETNTPAQIAERVAFARANTWDVRARTAVTILRERGLLRGTTPQPSAALATTTE